MTRIVETTPDGLTKIGLVTNRGDLVRRFPVSDTGAKIGWPSDISTLTDQHFIDYGLSLRISLATPAPALAEYGESATTDDERQPDGTWLQTWAVQSMALVDAQADLKNRSNSTYWGKIYGRPEQQETTDREADPLRMQNERAAALKPVLAQTVTDIDTAGNVEDAYAAYVTLRDYEDYKPAEPNRRG